MLPRGTLRAIGAHMALVGRPAERTERNLHLRSPATTEHHHHKDQQRQHNFIQSRVCCRPLLPRRGDTARGENWSELAVNRASALLESRSPLAMADLEPIDGALTSRKQCVAIPVR